LHTFHAWLSGGPHASPALAIAARFDARDLLIDELDLAQDCREIVVSVGGLDQRQLSLNWLAANGQQWSLQPASASDLVALLATAPAALQAQFEPWHRRSSVARRASAKVWGAIIALPVLGALLLLALWLGYPHASAWLAAQIPVTLEEKLGNALLASLREDGALIEKGPLQQAVQQTGQRLSAESRYRYRWIVKQDPSLNAFALPGGIVVVHLGLLQKMSDATELAGVLAHEVQHVEQRHGLRQMVSSLGLAGILALTVGDVSAMVALIAHQAGSTYFERDLEEQADRLGVQALLRAQIRPDGMLTLFKKLEQSQSSRKDGAESAPAWLASHPQTAQRISDVEALIAQQPCPACSSLADESNSLARALAAQAK
jgi:Zn-dependent protease with chaperone function